MSNLVYYVPGRENVVTDDKFPDLLEEIGCRDVVPTTRIEVMQVHKGPDKGRGITFAASAFQNDVRAITRPDFKWLEAERFWVGYDPSNPPTPAELSRATQIPGYNITLGDGNDWTVPLVRVESGESMLPRRYTVGRDGKPVLEPMDRYKVLTEHCMAFYQYFMQAVGENGIVGDVDVPDDKLFEYAIEALGVNYHIGRYEVALLGLLDTVNVRAVLGAAIDASAAYRMMVMAQETEEKKTPALTGDGLSTDVGSAA